jgi:hypothetical protein
MNTVTAIEDYGKTLKITMDRAIAANMLNRFITYKLVSLGYPCLGIYKDINIIPDVGGSRLEEHEDNLLLVFLNENDIFSLCIWLLKILILGWDTTSHIKLDDKILAFKVRTEWK